MFLFGKDNQPLTHLQTPVEMVYMVTSVLYTVTLDVRHVTTAFRVTDVRTGHMEAYVSILVPTAKHV